MSISSFVMSTCGPDEVVDIATCCTASQLVVDAVGRMDNKSSLVVLPISPTPRRRADTVGMELLADSSAVAGLNPEPSSVAARVTVSFASSSYNLSI